MTDLRPGRNIVLIGLMGAGKSTVGACLARILGRPLVDTDAVVEHESGSTVADIFAAGGERAFRQLEAAAVRHVCTLRGQVIAVGGGAVLDPANVTQLRATGDLVLLDADPATLAERIGAATDRPLLGDTDDPARRLSQLREQRAAAYAAAAAHVVDTQDRTPEQVAEAVLDWARRQPGLLSHEELAL